MFKKLVSRILQKDIGENVNIENVDSLVKTVLRAKAPHLYYSYLQMLDPTPTISMHASDKFDKSKELSPSCKDIWIFGYGSLVWKADFPFIDRLPGFITGYERKFYQNSIDHRGVPSFPGRVVTLVPTNNDSSKVYGVAYRIAESNVKEVLSHLDYREKNGYDRCSLVFNIYNSKCTVDVIMYVANADNDSFAGNISEESKIAEQIYKAVGPSGFNREYVYNLEEAMVNLFPGIEDHHLHKLVQLLREKESKDKQEIQQLLNSINEAISKDTNQDVIENEIVSLLLNFIDCNK